MNSFSYLNKADYSKFYHVTNTAKTITFLLSTTVLKLSSQSLTTTAFNDAFAPDYSASGNKLCYASNKVEGYVQFIFILVPNSFERKLATLDLDYFYYFLLDVLSVIGF